MSLFKSFLCLACTGALWLPAQAGVIVFPVPPSQTVSVGQVVSVYLRISGLGGASLQVLGAYDIFVGYEPTVLAFQGFTFGDPVLGDQLDLSGFGSVSSVTNDPGFPGGLGFVHLSEVSLDPADILLNLQASAFMLGNLQFVNIADGRSQLLIFGDLADQNGNRLDFTTQDGLVQTVPEPGTIWMIVVALGAIGFSRSMIDIRSTKRNDATKLGG